MAVGSRKDGRPPWAGKIASDAINHTSSFNARLEAEPSADLDFACRISTRNIAKIRGKIIGADGSEVDSIKHVEEISAQCEVLVFAEAPTLVR